MSHLSIWKTLVIGHTQVKDHQWYLVNVTVGNQLVKESTLSTLNGTCDFNCRFFQILTGPEEPFEEWETHRAAVIS